MSSLQGWKVELHMMLIGKAAIVGEGAEPELLSQSRTTLVRVPRTVMGEIFGGWGVRI